MAFCPRHIVWPRIEPLINYVMCSFIRLSDLLSFLVKLQRYLHNPPNFHWKRENGGIDICVTSGSQDGLVKV